MRAIVHSRYGSPNVLRLRDLPRPIPRNRDVLIKVHATSVNATDVEHVRGMFVVRLGAPLRPRYRILGSDVAGRVEAVGRAVTRLRPGDAVFGDLSPPRCSFGAFAEYVCAPEDALTRKPPAMTFEEAAAVTSTAMLALQALRHRQPLGSGQRVLINGAGGSVGTFAVQIAKSCGAEVTGVCSTRNVDMVRSIGADHVIDYRREDFTHGAARYDLILDNVANHPLRDCWRVLTPRGVHVPNSGRNGMPYILKALAVSLFVRRQASTYVATPKPGDLAGLRELIEAGKVTPILDRTYSLRDVPEAMRYLDEGHARGKVVITVPGEGP